MINKCENCNKDIKKTPIYGFCKIIWCSKKCWYDGLLRLARQKMTIEEIEILDEIREINKK